MLYTVQECTLKAALTSRSHVTNLQCLDLFGRVYMPIIVSIFIRKSPLSYLLFPSISFYTHFILTSPSPCIFLHTAGMSRFVFYRVCLAERLA